MENDVISIRRWGSRLSGKDAAKEVLRLCEVRLREDQLLTVNMAGIKDLTPGFAYECFGKLYITANKKGSRIKFDHVEPYLKPILLSGVKAALR